MFHIQTKHTNPKLPRWDTCDTLCFHGIFLGTRVSSTYPDLPVDHGVCWVEKFTHRVPGFWEGQLVEVRSKGFDMFI